MVQLSGFGYSNLTLEKLANLQAKGYITVLDEEGIAKAQEVFMTKAIQDNPFGSKISHVEKFTEFIQTLKPVQLKDKNGKLYYIEEHVDVILEKAYSGIAAEGEVRIWGGKSYQKTAGKWKYVGKHGTRLNNARPGDHIIYLDDKGKQQTGEVLEGKMTGDKPVYKILKPDGGTTVIHATKQAKIIVKSKKNLAKLYRKRGKPTAKKQTTPSKITTNPKVGDTISYTAYGEEKTGVITDHGSIKGMPMYKVKSSDGKMSDVHAKKSNVKIVSKKQELQKQEPKFPDLNMSEKTYNNLKTYIEKNGWVDIPDTENYVGYHVGDNSYHVFHVSQENDANPQPLSKHGTLKEALAKGGKVSKSDSTKISDEDTLSISESALEEVQGEINLWFQKHSPKSATGDQQDRLDSLESEAVSLEDQIKELKENAKVGVEKNDWTAEEADAYGKGYDPGDEADMKEYRNEERIEREANANTAGYKQEYKKGFTDFSLMFKAIKGKGGGMSQKGGVPIGTIHTWKNGKQYEKTANGWKPKGKGKGGGSGGGGKKKPISREETHKRIGKELAGGGDKRAIEESKPKIDKREKKLGSGKEDFTKTSTADLVKRFNAKDEHLGIIYASIAPELQKRGFKIKQGEIVHTPKEKQGGMDNKMKGVMEKYVGDGIINDKMKDELKNLAAVKFKLDPKEAQEVVNQFLKHRGVHVSESSNDSNSFKEEFLKNIEIIDDAFEEFDNPEEMDAHIAEKTNIPLKVVTEVMDKLGDLAENENPEASVEELLTTVLGGDEPKSDNPFHLENHPSTDDSGGGGNFFDTGDINDSFEDGPLGGHDATDEIMNTIGHDGYVDYMKSKTDDPKVHAQLDNWFEGEGPVNMGRGGEFNTPKELMDEAWDSLKNMIGER